MLKINIVCGPFLPIGNGPAGAVEKIWFGIARELVREGHQVSIIGRNWRGGGREELDGLVILRCRGFNRSGKITFDLTKDAMYSLSVLRFIPQADITVTNTFWFPVLARLRKRVVGKVVVNVARFPKGQMKLYRHVDRLSAVSTAVADEIIRQTPSVRHLVRVIPNPVDLGRFKELKNQTRSLDSRRILYTGRIHPEKGLHLLIEAVRRLSKEYPAVSLSLVGHSRVEYGGGGDAYVSELKELARGLPVTFEPSIDDPEALAHRMVEADYYCYPSLADKGESFGVAPLEAMALGYAPILSNLKCFGEFAEGGVNSFIFDHQGDDPVGSLCSALKLAISCPDRYQQMGQNAVKTAQKFSYRKIAKAYINDWISLQG